jgi:WD40 repeat protein
MAMMMATSSSQVQSLLLHKARCFDVKTIRKCGSEGSHNVAERAVTGSHGESDINTTTGSSSGRSVPETEDTLILTSSEDGTAVLWSANTRKHLFVFRHSTECEVLRSNFVDRHSANRILTCGADGTVLVWARSNAGSNEGLFNKAMAGTKNIVERYHRVIREALCFICDSEVDDVSLWMDMFCELPNILFNRRKFHVR